MSSISFDRAVDFYDKTRGLPPEQAERVSDVLVRELADRGRALEIGVGTGRIALPLHARGVDLVGIDISLPMLERLVTNSSGRPPFAIHDSRYKTANIFFVGNYCRRKKPAFRIARLEQAGARG